MQYKVENEKLLLFSIVFYRNGIRNAMMNGVMHYAVVNGHILKLIEIIG